MAKTTRKMAGGGLGRTGRNNGLTVIPKKKAPGKKTAKAKARTRKT